MKCGRCGANAVPRLCHGDQRRHWHGEVHTADGGLMALCNEHHAEDKHKWQELRKARTEKQGGEK